MYSEKNLNDVLARIHDMDVAEGKAPFLDTLVEPFAKTAGYTPDYVLTRMAEIRAERSTRLPPNSSDDPPGD